MKIVVYGKEGCERCVRAKQHIKKMGYDYQYKDIGLSIEPHDEWRADNSVNLLAYLSSISGAYYEVPVIMVDGLFYRYTEAMKVLKTLSRQCEIRKAVG